MKRGRGFGNKTLAQLGWFEASDFFVVFTRDGERERETEGGRERESWVCVDLEVDKDAGLRGPLCRVFFLLFW